MLNKAAQGDLAAGAVAGCRSLVAPCPALPRLMLTSKHNAVPQPPRTPRFLLVQPMSPLPLSTPSAESLSSFLFDVLYLAALPS